MPTSISQLIDNIIAIQRDIATPGGARAIQLFTDEPQPVNQFPAFVNVETATDPRERAANAPYRSHYIDMQLIFAAVDTKYSVRERRLWTDPVLTKFEDTWALSTTDFRGLMSDVRYSTDKDPIIIGGFAFVGTTFTLEARLIG